MRCHRMLDFLESPIQDSQLTQFTTYPPAPHLDNEFKMKEKQAVEQLLDSFVIVPPRANASRTTSNQTNWHRRAEAITKILEVASDKCQLDHPLCRDCSSALVKELESRINELQRDSATFASRYDDLTSTPMPQPDPKFEETEKADVKLELRLQLQLKDIQRERELLRQEQQQLETESKELSKFERRFWEEYQDFQRELAVVNDEQLSLSQKLDVAKEQLERMKRTNVFDDAFHIYYDGHFGTINGFRLGRLPSQPVDWMETNAGLGQVVLLLYTITKYCGTFSDHKFKLQKYNLIPMGSFSKMSKQDDDSAFELYGSNDLNFSRLFWYRRFDTALLWLLDCIEQFGQYATKVDPSFKLKYPIKGDTIDGLSIKLQFNQEAKWTKALKYMLSNLKLLLAWASKHIDH